MLYTACCSFFCLCVSLTCLCTRVESAEHTIKSSFLASLSTLWWNSDEVITCGNVKSKWVIRIIIVQWQTIIKMTLTYDFWPWTPFQQRLLTWWIFVASFIEIYLQSKKKQLITGGQPAGRPRRTEKHFSAFCCWRSAGGGAWKSCMISRTLSLSMTLKLNELILWFHLQKPLYAKKSQKANYNDRLSRVSYYSYWCCKYELKTHSRENKILK